MKTNKRIIRILIVISAMFLALLSYLLYFNMFRAEEISASPYNRRQWDEERYVTRGTIYDRGGLVLAETNEDSDGNSERVYPYGRLYSHVIGYCSQVYGKSMLEQQYDSELLGKGDLSIFAGDKKRGYDLNLTISHSLQKYTYEQMKGRSGAAVAIDPNTGEVLAMVSLPDFEPDSDKLEKSWSGIVESEDSPLLARATGGLYAPGSTYKLVTMAAAYENGMQDKVFEDTGSFTLGSIQVDNYGGKAYGEISIEDAFKVSSNQVFCTVGHELGSEAMLDISKRFGIGSEPEFDVPMSKSVIQYKKMTNADAALVAIGQGQLLATPLHMAMICGAAANGGKLMRPYMVGSVAKNNVIISEAKPKLAENAISADCAEYLTEQMTETVKSGTATRAAISGISVAGKTGTAENETGKDHAWFVGFAPAENPQIAVAVILEYSGGSGGENAAPIAGSIMRKYLGK